MSNDEDNSNFRSLTAALKNALENKRQNLAGKPSDVLENLTPKIRRRVECLKEIQGKHGEIEAKFLAERAALEAKYQKLYQPLYTERCEIVNGAQGEEKGVPSFWLTALKNNDAISEEITERDEGALMYLKDIKWCKTEKPKGFKLEFFFDDNPYFKNTLLTKAYRIIDEDEPLLENAIGTEIDWYPEKCLTLKEEPKKGAKNDKPITKTEVGESFFNFFNPPQVPALGEPITEDRVEVLQNLMEQDYDIGSTIREKIIPHAVSWFTGEAIEREEFDDNDDEDDTEGEEFDDNDDEDDTEGEEFDDNDYEDDIDGDEVEEEEPSVLHKKGGGPQLNDGQQEPTECKQQ